jgi:hypothetical protein
MANISAELLGSAFAVAVLGNSAEKLALLDDDAVLTGMTLISNHERHLQSYKLALAAEIARRSSHELGYSGLARKHGAPTPTALIQSLTGDSLAEANKLALLGQSVVDDDASTIIDAATSGKISVDAADAIRRGLGSPDEVVTAEQLSDEADKLIADADKNYSPEFLLKKARQARNALDLDSIEREQKQRSDIRYLKVWRKDGMSSGRWALPDEDGGIEIYNAVKLLVAKQTSGPRFVENRAGAVKPSDSNESFDGESAGVSDDAAPIAHPSTASTTPQQSPVPAQSTVPQQLDDTRSFEQIMVDGFAQIFHNGLTADPSIVPGAGRAAVRVIVEEKVLKEKQGFAILEDSLSAITFSKLEEYLCEGGSIGVLFDDDGKIDVGREQRIFTTRQRTALGVRDGGCRYPGCDKPPSWCEAHHIDFWARDVGKTDIENGILLCRYHHMLIHNNDWEILRRDGTYWLRRPKSIDPSQTLIEMPSKNPLVEAMQLRRETELVAV